MTTTIRVLGVPALVARFARAAALGEVASAAAVDALGDDVALAARLNAPVDTGALADSIRNDRGHVTVEVDYAAYVEYGTSDTPPQPFLRPAADTVNDSRALGIAASVMRQA